MARTPPYPLPSSISPAYKTIAYPYSWARTPHTEMVIDFRVFGLDFAATPKPLPPEEDGNDPLHNERRWRNAKCENDIGTIYINVLRVVWVLRACHGSSLGVRPS